MLTRDAQLQQVSRVTYPVTVKYRWGTRWEEAHFRITWDKDTRKLTTSPAD